MHYADRFYKANCLIIFVILFNSVYSQQYVGNSCKLRRTNESGKCKALYNCPRAVEDLRCQGISPQTCGFEGVQAIVCCAESTSSPKLYSALPVGSKSKQKCEEYGKHATAATEPASPSLENVSITKECAFLNIEFLTKKNKAWAKEFPHMAAIGFDGDNENEKVWICSGALISEQFVLTAAHCLYDIQYGVPKYIRLGDLILDTDLDDSLLQEFNIIEVFRHPNFKKPSFYNNIGLLKMDRAANFNSYARPACLDTNPSVIQEEAVVTGWARESSLSDDNSHLLKETLKFFSNDECRDTYKNVTTHILRNGIVEAQVCAGPRETQKTCIMGPGVLQVYSEVYCMYSVVGITSFARGCGLANVPDVFSRISDYIEWIEGIVWP